MFKKIIAAVIATSLVAGRCLAADVQVNVRELDAGPAAHRNVTITLVEPQGSTAGDWLIAGSARTKATDANGLVTFSNILSIGDYRLDIAGSRGWPFNMTAATTNGTYNVTQLMGTNAAVQRFYNTTQVDAMLAGSGFIAQNAAGTNASAVTNAGVVTFSADVSHGEVSRTASNIVVLALPAQMWYSNLPPWISNLVFHAKALQGVATTNDVRTATNDLWTAAVARSETLSNNLAALNAFGTNQVTTNLVAQLNAASNVLRGVVTSTGGASTSYVNQVVGNATNDLNTVLRALINTASNFVYAAGVNGTNDSEVRLKALISAKQNFSLNLSNYSLYPTSTWASVYSLLTFSNIISSMQAYGTNFNRTNMLDVVAGTSNGIVAQIVSNGGASTSYVDAVVADATNKLRIAYIPVLAAKQNSNGNLTGYSLLPTNVMASLLQLLTFSNTVPAAVSNIVNGMTEDASNVVHTAGDRMTGPLTNDSAIGFKGNGGSLTNIQGSAVAGAVALATSASGVAAGGLSSYTGASGLLMQTNGTGVNNNSNSLSIYGGMAWLFSPTVEGTLKIRDLRANQSVVSNVWQFKVNAGSSNFVLQYVRNDTNSSPVAVAIFSPAGDGVANPSGSPYISRAETNNFLPAANVPTAGFGLVDNSHLFSADSNVMAATFMRPLFSTNTVIVTGDASIFVTPNFYQTNTGSYINPVNNQIWITNSSGRWALRQGGGVTHTNNSAFPVGQFVAKPGFEFYGSYWVQFPIDYGGVVNGPNVSGMLTTNGSTASNFTITSGDATLTSLTLTNLYTAGSTLLAVDYGTVHIMGAGSDEVNGGVYETNSAMGVFTNTANHFVIRFQNPVWFIQWPGSTNLYSASNVWAGPWLKVSGSNSVPTSSPGVTFNWDGVRNFGWRTDTNFEARLIGMSNTIVSTVSDSATASARYSSLYTNVIYITETLPTSYLPADHFTSVSGRYFATSTNFFFSDSGLFIYKTNSTDWVLDSSDFLYGVLFHCPSNFPVGPWYPDQNWIDNGFPSGNRLAGSLTTSNTAAMAQQAREALRTYQPTKVSLPFAYVAVSPADAVSMADAVAVVKGFGLQGLISGLEIDNWAASTRNAQGQLQFDTGLFPGGWTSKLFSDYAKTNGFKYAGQHYDRGIFTGTGGSGQFGSEGYQKIDADGIATNGINFVLLDTTRPATLGEKNDRDVTTEFITAIRESAITAGSQVHVFGAFHGGFSHSFQTWMPIADSYWISGDSSDIAEVLIQFRQSLPWNGFGRYMTFANPQSSLVTSNGARQLLGLAAIGPANLQYLTNALYSSPFRSVFTGTQWFDAWQDPAGARGDIVKTNASGMVLSRPLANGDTLLMFLNLSNGVTTLTAKWEEFGFPTNRPMFAKDVFYQTNSTALLTMLQSVTLNANDASLWRLTPLPSSTSKALTVQNPISLDAKFTNTYSMTADLMVGYTLVGAVGGNPTLVYSNFTTGDFFQMANTISAVANETNTVTISGVGPNEVIGFFDRSAGAGAAATVNRSTLKFR